MRLPTPVLKALLHAFYEYLLLTSPVFVYVLFEALVKHKAQYFFISPEWSIATLFLASHGRSLYKKNLSLAGERLSEISHDLLEFGVLAVIISSSINAYISLQNNSWAAILFRLIIFGLVSVTFILFAGAGKLTAIRREESAGCSGSAR
jgi:hypothetical protein